MGKTAKTLPPIAVPSMNELKAMAAQVCQESDDKESEIRELAKAHGAVEVDELAAKLLYVYAKDLQAYSLETISSQRQASSERHREVVNFLHDQPNGSREKRQRMREIWASGKYLTREACAEKNYELVGMSFDTAKKALRNQPAPSHASKSPAEWLRDLITDSACNSRDIYRTAKAAGYSRDAMKRAKRSIGVVVTKQGKDWFWCLK
jgi:hypothetical protein